jgi:hypothetical protein
LIEFKLASNAQLKRNLERQVAIYEQANQTSASVKVIICYTSTSQTKVARIIHDLGLGDREDIIITITIIDTRNDTSPPPLPHRAESQTYWSGSSVG